MPNEKSFRMGKGRLVAMLLSLAALACMSCVAASHADAGAATSEFCSNATLGRYGQSTDWCAGGGSHRNYLVQVQAFEHSSCASSTTNGNKGGVNASWVCTMGGSGEVTVNYVNSSVCTYGIIRNNDVNATTRATGVVAYYTEGC